MEELSREQQLATFADSDKALVIAGAGSGKTRVLTSRIAHLLQDCNVSPYEVAVFTFTRKAAGEMKERLEAMIGNQVHKLTIGTMHSVFLKMIQRFGELVGLRPEKITIYSEWEQQFLFKDIAKEMGYHTGKAWKGIKKKEIDHAFHVFYTTGGRSDNDLANEILDIFFARCKENNALTYGTILTTFYDLLPKIQPYLNFRHIMVDETQDNDELQWKIINLMQSLTDASLYAVGDANQCLYSFRGADPEYLIRHQSEFDIFKLEDNYRSDANVVESANKMIDNNSMKLDYSMSPKRPAINDIHVLNNTASEDICRYLKHYLLQEPEKEIAVLGRNHFLLEKLSRLLKEEGIDHEYVGKKTALVRSEEFRKFHAFFKLVINEFDNFSFLLIKEYINISHDEYRSIRMLAVQEYKSHYQAWIDFDDPEDIKTYAKEMASLDDKMMGELIELMGDIDFDFDTKPMLDFINDWMVDQHEPKISSYLDWLATFDVQDEIKEESKQQVQLMTIHGSKGLEWPVVIIAGLNEGIFPSKHAQHSEKELESERRLAYVGWTRAKEQLILTSRPITDKDGNIKNPVSRFIGEGECN